MADPTERSVLIVDKQPSQKKAVILIHGMGTQSKNTMLLVVAGAVASWMDRHRNRSRPAHYQPQLEERLCKDAPSSIDLTFAGQRWRFIEAYWANSFDKPLFDPMIGWTAQRFVFHLWALGTSTLFHTLVPFLVAIGLFAAYLAFVLVPTALLLLPLLLAFAISSAVGIVLLPFVLRNLTGRVFVVGALIITVGSFTYLLRVVSPEGWWANRHPGVGASVWVSIFASMVLAVVVQFLLRRIVKAQPQPAEDPVGTPSRLQRIQLSSTRPERLLPKNTVVDPRYYLAHGPAAIVWKWLGDWTTGALRAFDEHLLAERLFSLQCGVWERVRVGVLVFFQGLFHVGNALVSVAIYFTGVFLIIPVIFLVWALSLGRAIPAVRKLVEGIKKRLDAFLVGSLGDVKVFVDDPAQARRIRREVERALDSVHQDLEFHDAEIFLLAHSTGAPIAFETLALDSNAPRLAGIKAVITAGSIMAMVSRMGSRRSSLDAPLPQGVRWVNIWTRYDPALAGPVPRKIRARNGGKVIEVPVSNEDDPFSDHSAYWANDHQVLPRLVSEVWGPSTPYYFDFREAEELGRTKRRKYRILALSSFRLAVWGFFPFTFWGTLLFLNNMQVALEQKTVVKKVIVEGVSIEVPTIITANVAQLGKGAPLRAVLNAWEWVWNQSITYLDKPVLRDLTLQANNPAKKVVAAIVVSCLITLAAYLVYKFLRAILWDGFFKEMHWFRA